MAHSNDNLGTVTRYHVESHKLQEQGQQALKTTGEHTRMIENAIGQLAEMDIENAFAKLRSMVAIIKDKPADNVVAFPAAKARQSAEETPMALAAE